MFSGSLNHPLPLPPVDRISYLIFEKCPSLRPALLDRFNRVIMEGSVPSSWKVAAIKLIPKSCAQEDPSGYCFSLYDSRGGAPGQASSCHQISPSAETLPGLNIANAYCRVHQSLIHISLAHYIPLSSRVLPSIAVMILRPVWYHLNRCVVDRPCPS